MKTDLILGGGVAGLINGFYTTNSIIDENPLGQINTQYIPGPRIFKKDEYVEKFLKRLEINFHTEEVNIGYSFDGFSICELDDVFKKKYSKITRGTEKVESSFLSSGESNFNILTDGSDDFYYKVFQKLYEILESKIITARVLKIDLKNKTVDLSDGQQLKYDSCISTLNLNIFQKLCNFNCFNLETSFKHFVWCRYDNGIDKELSRSFNYIYSVNGIYSRKTYFNDYIVYEMLSNEKFSQIETNKVIKTMSAPIQINNSIDIRDVGGVKMSGRFAQWNHSIKSNEIIKKYEQ